MRGSCYQRFVVLVCLYVGLCFASLQAVAATAPAYNGRMNAAVAGVVQFKTSKWGFAANDPRVTATFAGVGTGLTAIAVGVATGAVATVGWPALLIGAGVAAVVTGSMSLAWDSVYKWLFNSDGTITTTVGAGGGALVMNGPYLVDWSGKVFYPAPHTRAQADDTWRRLCARDNSCAGTEIALAQTIQSTKNNLPITVYFYEVKKNGYPWSNFNLTLYSIGSPANCAANMILVDGVCTGMTSGESAGIANAKPAAAIENIPPSELSKPVSNQFLAAAANTAWKAATNAGGLPWAASDPVTPADVAEWVAANPSMVPTVGDAIAPVSNGSAVVVSPGGSSQPSTGPVATPGTGTNVDLGPNPNTPAPALESTPTAQQILAPVLGLMPDLKSFSVPTHSASCPTASFAAFGQTYVLNSHCGLIESNRRLIEAAMLLCWTLASVLIVLRA